ncbi:aldo/keto reductase [Mycolicibacterium setense]|uniref:aldo/keto reductase n=1 Tax=Mycolicibacterium setense TaxID=431269 RepID=UPI000574707D|nr:aldo/keto reductase [Mycolicibacterium setense]KHO21740.1 aldo/keto reductase [Mycolicibacterium setense]MCV7114110.1 aldo/keto reductase [Mycolicibacterium setense]
MTLSTARRRLGTNGPEVSAIGLGFMSFRTGTGPEDEKQADAIVAEAVDLGITLFDTADVYGPEFSEILLGKAIRGRRDAVTIATKFGNALDRETNPDARALDGRPEYVRSALEGSLRRLGVDHIDLYYQHRVDPDVPIEDTVGALKELVEAGKVRHIGLSEPGPQTLRRAHAVHPIAAIQNEWSLFTRDIERDTLPIARELGIGIVPYSPLGRGWLTGRVRSAEDVKGVQSRHPRFGAEVFDRNRALADTVTEIAVQIGVQPSQVALAWVLSRGQDVVPIPGTRHVEYLRENVGALTVELSDEHVGRLEAIADQVGGHRSIRPEHLGVEAPVAAAS